MNDIQNNDLYNQRMRLSLIDKMFFVDKVEIQGGDVVVDFGCADGTLIQHLRHYLPEGTRYVGYDINPAMKEAAERNLGDAARKQIELTTEWSEVEKKLKTAKKSKKILILSSVIHEVYFYGSPKEVDDFWNHVFNTGFDFIVIRDMIPGRSIDRPADMNDVLLVRRNAHRERLEQFEGYWGKIESHRNLVHFLLKYRYVEGWQREVKENYLPLYRDDLMYIIRSPYAIDYHEHFVLPFIRRVVLRDFGIRLADHTHLKLILRREN